jgi:hypothetical protein
VTQHSENYKNPVGDRSKMTELPYPVRGHPDAGHTNSAAGGSY